MRFKIDGRVLEAPETLRIRESCEAEKHLGMSIEDGFTARIAVMLFAALRKEEPDKPPYLIAEEVMNADLGSLEEVEEARPPEVAPEGAETQSENHPTTGPLRSVQSA